MLFNSYAFIFLFLPIVFFGFYALGRYSRLYSSVWLALASLFFYSWWDVRFLGLLLGSIAFNFSAGYFIGQQAGKRAKLLLISALTVNLALLGYFKYANFFLGTLNTVFNAAFPIGEIFLPLGISFFTFTQIAFLVDTYQGKVKEFNPIHYTLFVTYFPHLIAGPVLHHKEMMPQFERPQTSRINWENIALGFSIFVLGLSKKILIADTIANYSTPIFQALSTGGQPMLIEAWIGALAYSLQLYFDFSAYSDMAIGLSLLFNVKLPINFNSPYKATSIIDFWRRWHMTLSRFLRDYLYIPLGGNRKGEAQRYINLLITMLLGGLWHGAGWTFIIWGGLHGIYLTINHQWRQLKQKLNWGDGGKTSAFFAKLLTFLAVVVGWVFFRADSFSSALVMLQGMIGLNGISLPTPWQSGWANPPAWLSFSGVHTLAPTNELREFSSVIIGLIIVFTLPNIQQMVLGYKTGFDTGEIETASESKTLLRWRPSIVWALLTSILFFISLLSMNAPSEFLYFQF